MSILDNLMRGWPIIFRSSYAFLSAAVCFYKLTRSRNNNSSYTVKFVQIRLLVRIAIKRSYAWAADNLASVDRLFLPVIK